MEAGAVTCYTDGSCLGNPGPGGWGVATEQDDGTFVDQSGGEANTTNNRMELLGCIRALETLGNTRAVLIKTDSRYVIDGIERWISSWKMNGWRTKSKQPVKNKDLWERLDALKTTRVRFEWVAGHTGSAGNERADALARAAAHGNAAKTPGD